MATRQPIRNLFLFDILKDRDSRSTVLWAAGTLLLGTLAYTLMEGWSPLDSLYFCVISLATVGYGDLAPSGPLSRIFTIFYVLNGIAILLSLIDRIRVVRSAGMARAARAPGVRDLSGIDSSPDGLSQEETDQPEGPDD